MEKWIFVISSFLYPISSPGGSLLLLFAYVHFFPTHLFTHTYRALALPGRANMCKQAMLGPFPAEAQHLSNNCDLG